MPKRARASVDYVLVLAVVGLLVIGLMMVYSATFDWSYQEYGSTFRIASKQFLWVGLGLVGLVVFAAIPYDRWRQLAVPIMGGTLLLLILVLLLGEEHFGARRSFLGGSIQPGELTKLAIVIYVSTWLASKGDQIRDVTYGLIPFAVLIGVVASLIVMQPDVSTAILVVLTALAMFFFAGADIFQLAAGGAVSVVTFFLLINQLAHAKKRLVEWLETWRDPTLVGYHIQQALIALGNGGAFGVGLGQGQQKIGYLPTPHTDSIFAVLGEEMGFIGCLLVIGLFVLLVYRGFRIAQGAPDAFAALLACGVTCWLAFQALVNMAVMTGLVPFTGVALPFISFGGSSMVVSLVGVGLLLSVSRGKPAGQRKSKSASPLKGNLRYASLDRRWGNRGTRLSRPVRRSGANHVTHGRRRR
jgi:cell division protein FtsW